MILIVALLGSAALAEEQSPPASPRKQIDLELHGMMLNIKNAQQRLSHGVVGLGQDPSAPATPLQVCCTQNLKRLEKRVQGFVESAGLLYACYEDTGDGASMTQLGLVKEDLDNLVTALQQWASADARHARGSGENVTRMYLNLRRSADELAACPPETDAPGESPTSEP